MQCYNSTSPSQEKPQETQQQFPNYKKLCLRNYFNYYFSTLSPVEKDVLYRGYINHVLPRECYESCLALPHVILTPAKVAGYLTWPIHYYCLKKLKENSTFSGSSSSSSLLCLRFLLVDLTIQAKFFKNLWRIHLFGVINLACLIVMALDVFATLIVWFNWAVLATITLASPLWYRTGQPFEGKCAKTILYAWQIIFLPAIIALQLQFFLLPYWAWTNKSFFDLVLPQDLNTRLNQHFTQSFGDFELLHVISAYLPSSLHIASPIRHIFFFALQLFWIPVVCSVEELSFTKMQSILSDNGPFWIIGKAFRGLTILIQCIFGVSAYVLFLVLAVLHEFASRNVSYVIKTLMHWHQQPLEETARELEVDINHGLTSEHAAQRFAKYGPNDLHGSSGPSAFKVFLANLLNAMNLLLLAALIFSAAVLQDWAEVAVLGVGLLLTHVTHHKVIVTNTGIGFFQEYRSEKTMEALRKLSSPTARVKRDNEIDIIACDIVLLEEGTIVPADMRLFEAVNLQIDEAILTGESMPVSKSIGPIERADIPLGDRKNMAFKNTLVSRGRGCGIVVSTGLLTEIGKIAMSVMGERRNQLASAHSILEISPETNQNTETMKKPSLWKRMKDKFQLGILKTPLQRTMDRLMFSLIICAFFLALLVFASNSFVFEGYVVLYAVSVAVIIFIYGSNIQIAILPEGLPAVITVTMAVGVRRMAQQKAIVRKLAALEALGQVTNICSDKTGTLTEGKMVMKYIWFSGNLLKITGEGISPFGEFCQVADIENTDRADALDIKSITEESSISICEQNGLTHFKIGHFL